MHHQSAVYKLKASLHKVRVRVNHFLGFDADIKEVELIRAKEAQKEAILEEKYHYQDVLQMIKHHYSFQAM